MQEPASGILKPIYNLARHSAIYAISTSIQRLQGLILLPFYTNSLYIASRSEFGNYILVYTFIAFMNFFYLYGMDSALMRYFFLGKHDRKTVFSSTFLFLLFSSIATTILIFIFSASIAGLFLEGSQYAQFIRLAGLILLLDSLVNLPFLLLRLEEKPLQFTLFRVLRFILELTLNILFVVILKKGVPGILYANILAAFLSLLFMSPIILRYLKLQVNRSLWLEMVRFGLPFLPNGIAYMTIEMVDRILVQKILDKDAVGLYGANYKFGTILLLLVIAFRNAWQPFFLKIADQGNARQTYSRVLTYFIVGGGLVLLFTTYLIRDVLTFHYFGSFYLFGPQYWSGIGIIPVILLSYLFFGIYVVLTPGFYIQKKSQFMVVFTGSAAVINIAANLVLLPVLGIWGAALATLISYITMAITIYLVADKIYPIPVEWSRILKMFVLIGLGFALHYSFSFPFIADILLLIIFVWICYRFILQKEERQVIRMRLVSLRK